MLDHRNGAPVLTLPAYLREDAYRAMGVGVYDDYARWQADRLLERLAEIFAKADVSHYSVGFNKTLLAFQQAVDDMEKLNG